MFYKKSLSFFAMLVLWLSEFPFSRKRAGTGGVSTGEAKIYTSKRTTGIVDEKAAKVFENVTASTPMKNFQCVSGGKAKDFVIETTACMVAMIEL
ncbi:MAG: hypothetical protein WKF73_16595 [Nocardioidaceae bacterium]